MTIKADALNLLKQYGWSDEGPRGFSHRKTGYRIYIGSRTSIRKGYTKAESVPVVLAALRVFLEGVDKRDEPVPVVKQLNPLTDLRRRAHAIVQTMTLDTLNAFVGGEYVLADIDDCGEIMGVVRYHINAPTEKAGDSTEEDSLLDIPMEMR